MVVIVTVGSSHSRWFGTAEYQFAAGRALAGQNFYGFVDYDERSYEQLMARDLHTPIRVLVAGSSRTMQLERDCFDDAYYNASVGAAMVSDVAAVVEEFRRGREFKHVVFAADPWILDETGRTGSWKDARRSAAPDWIRAQLKLGLTPDPRDWFTAVKAGLEPYREILAPASFQPAWGIFAHIRPETTQDLKNLFRKEPDGSLRYPDFFVNVTEAQAEKVAIDSADQHLEKVYKEFPRLDPHLVRAFEAMTASVQASGARVTLFLAPFHPAYYERVVHNGGGRMLPTVESYFRNLAKERGYEVIGAYDPAVLGVPASDFFDGVHMKKAPLKRLFGCREGPRP